MSKAEQLPLLTFTNKRSANGNGGECYNSGGYLVLSVPQHKAGSNIGKFSFLLIATSAVVFFVVIVIGITYHTDVTELVRSNKLKAEASPSNSEFSFPLGNLKGYSRTSRKGREFLAFFKVPYAKPPIGNLRFKDPEPVEKWEGLRDVREVAPQCIQKSKYASTDEAVGEEDCLYMNIYIPQDVAASSNSAIESLNYPTMVYIHGGGFGDGNGSRYGAEYFMDENVVLITFEFRLGLFGFLNTGDREATGNMGFKDQVMALKWVKDYVSYFGGDPTRVTIFGNSAGGFSVGFLKISPMTTGLIHRAISQSGTVLTESADILDLQPEKTAKAAAQTFNCSMSTSRELVECLRTKDAKDIALLKTPETKFGLTVEQGFDQNDMSSVFMPDKPYALLKAGKVNPVPYLIGINSAEWIAAALVLLKNEEKVKEINANFSDVAPKLLGIDVTPEECEKIKSFYFGDQDISNGTERNLTNLVSDRVMVHGSKVTADFHSQVSETYLYYLSKRPRKSYADRITADFPWLENDKEIVSHADEIQFLFPYAGYPEYPQTDLDYFPFSEYLVKLWANFAATGKPMLSNGEEWPTVGPERNSSFWYELNDSPGRTFVLQERMEFWDQFSHKQLQYDL